ncbi:hypothetical protein B0H11DRAFT_2103129 [Mycena galericulata]|nr:hypothetical protein B0H11DRAFT_2103129 [Mycena galericulata]
MCVRVYWPAWCVSCGTRAEAVGGECGSDRRAVRMYPASGGQTRAMDGALSGSPIGVVAGEGGGDECRLLGGMCAAVLSCVAHGSCAWRGRPDTDCPQHALFPLFLFCPLLWRPLLLYSNPHLRLSYLDLPSPSSNPTYSSSPCPPAFRPSSILLLSSPYTPSFLSPPPPHCTLYTPSTAPRCSTPSPRTRFPLPSLPGLPLCFRTPPPRVPSPPSFAFLLPLLSTPLSPSPSLIRPSASLPCPPLRLSGTLTPVSCAKRSELKKFQGATSTLTMLEVRDAGWGVERWS